MWMILNFLQQKKHTYLNEVPRQDWKYSQQNETKKLTPLTFWIQNLTV